MAGGIQWARALASGVGRSLVSARGVPMAPLGNVAALSGMAFPGAHAGLRSLALSAACRAGTLPAGSAAAAGRRQLSDAASAPEAAPAPAAAAPYTPAPDKSMFAVVRVGGKQYKVTEHDAIVVEKRLNNGLPMLVGEALTLDEVLMVGNAAGTTLGKPIVEGAKVLTIVEQQTLSPKVYIFKMRRRKNSRRFRGYRASVTQLRIMKISAPP